MSGRPKMICGLRPQGGDGTIWCLLPRGHKGLHEMDDFDGRRNPFRKTSGRGERVIAPLEEVESTQVTAPVQRAEYSIPYSPLASATAYGFDHGFASARRIAMNTIDDQVRDANQRGAFEIADALRSFQRAFEERLDPNVLAGATGLLPEQVKAILANLDKIEDPIVRHVLVGALVAGIPVEQSRSDGACGICGLGTPSGLSGMCQGCQRSYDRDAHEEGHVLEAMIWAANRARLGALATGTKRGGRHGR